MNNMTGNDGIDARIRAFITDVETSFHKPLRAVYLTGSWSDGTAVKRSDVDIVMVFKGQATDQDAATFQTIVDRHQTEDGPELGPLPMDDDDLQQPLPAYLKYAKHLHGDDIMATCELLAIDQVMRRWTHGSLRLMCMLRNTKTLNMPLYAPNPTRADLGLNLTTQHTTPSTKLIISAVARIAGARLAHERRYHALSKHDAIMRYGDSREPLAEFVREIWQAFKVDWGYDLPNTPEANAHLTALLRQYIDFENNFLTWALPLIQANINHDKHNQWSTQCLGLLNASTPQDS